MKCYYHPRRNAVATCVNCGRPLCAECKSELGGKNYCTACANEIFVVGKHAEETELPVKTTRHTTAAAEMSSPATKSQTESPAAESGIIHDKRNWFERHLNWTLVLVSSVCAFLAWQAGILSWLTFLGYLLYLIMVLFITVWYIRQKGRRYKHLLWIVVPVVGQIALICLANHRTQKAVATASLSSAEAETAKENVKASRTKRSETTSPETVATTAEHKTPRKKLLAVIGGVAALAVILIIALLIPELDHVPSNGTSPPTQSTPDQPALQTMNQAGLSTQQTEIVDSFGWPHSFSIFEITDENNSAQRIDTWTYFDSGITLVFLNGEFLNTEPADQLPPGFIATPYTPNQFIMGASPDEVSSLAIGSEWVGMPGVDDLIEGGGLYVAQQLVTAFSENRLVFVEAVAIVPEGSN